MAGVPIRVVIADDHGVVRQGLRTYLSLDPDLRIVGEAADGAQALSLARELKPDVVLMDLLMPVMDGIAATSALRRELPDVEVLVLTGVVEDRYITAAIRAGAIGLVFKDASPGDLCRAIRAAAAGHIAIEPRVAAKLVEDLRAPETVEALTERETQVMRLLARGLSNREISETLDIGEKTVKTHVSSILSKLRLPSRTQAALYAMRAGLGPLTE